MIEAQTPNSPPEWVKAMTIGGIVDRALKIYRSAFFDFFGVALVMMTPAMVMSLSLSAVQTDFAAGAGSSALVFLPVVFVSSLLSWLAGLWGSGTLIYMGSEHFLGRPCGFKKAAHKGFEFFGPILAASILFGLMVGGIFGGMGILSAIMVPMLTKVLPTVGIIIVVVALVVVFVALALNFFLSYLCYTQAVVIDGKGPVESLKRSRFVVRKLTDKGWFRGNIWRLSIVLLIVIAVQLAMGAMSMLVFYVLGIGSMGMAEVGQASWVNSLATVVQLAGQAFIYPVSILAMTYFYYDVLIRKEGLDVKLRSATLGTGGATTGESAGAATE